VAIEAPRSDGQALTPLGPETTGQIPQDELFTPDDFIVTVSTYVSSIRMDSDAPFRGNILRLPDQEVKAAIDEQSPTKWKSPEGPVERYLVYLNPNYDREVVAVAFLHQLVAIKTDVDRHRNHPRARKITEEEKRAEAARLESQARVFYRTHGDLVDSRLDLVWSHLSTA
jgi:hypothetical protein